MIVLEIGSSYFMVPYMEANKQVACGDDSLIPQKKRK